VVGDDDIARPHLLVEEVHRAPILVVDHGSEVLDLVEVGQPVAVVDV